MSELSEEFRKYDAEWRLQTVHHHIDPGFINKRLCGTAFGPGFVSAYSRYARPETDHWARLANDHLAVDLGLEFCLANEIPPLGAMLQDPVIGQVFCSTERLKGVKTLWGRLRRGQRIRNRVILRYPSRRSAILDFSGEHFVADTGREEQAHESVVSIIGTVRSVGPKQVVCYPIVMGAPSFDHARNKSVQGHSLSWYSGEWYEVFAEDLDEFAEARVVNPTTEEWLSYMRTCSEAHVKATFGRLLAEPLRADWGGELDDLFASAAHIRERRTTVAFLLKGPGGGFREMTPDLLGKRADQVVRLASTPAQLLVVQHCHTIGEAVRQTLRAFCVAPHHPRRYCLIDGKDTYRILKAYHSLQP